MENTNNTITGLQKMVTDNIRQIADVSISAFKPVLDHFAGNFSTINKQFFNEGGLPLKIPQFKLQSDDCCTPKNECPPHCIATITRTAMPGERIIVLFTVKNNCSTTRTYRVGVRELKDADGQMAPSQPHINKASITLQPGGSERILMGIDLANFTSGKTYSAEIVLREKEYNQNICFTLQVSDEDGIIAYPQDEKKYRMRWKSWKSHFYCEPEKGGRIPGQEG